MEHRHQVYDVVMQGDHTDNYLVGRLHVYKFQEPGRDRDMAICTTTCIEKWWLLKEEQDGTAQVLSDEVSFFWFRVCEKGTKRLLEIDAHSKSGVEWGSVLEGESMELPAEDEKWTTAAITNVLEPYFKGGGTVTVTKMKTELCQGCTQIAGENHELRIDSSNMAQHGLEVR